MEKSVDIKFEDKITPANISYTDSPPWSVVLYDEEGVVVRSDGDDLFDALINLRNKLEKKGALIMCHGARRDVYPSAMSRNMGGGVMAYQLTVGEPARRTDMVNIFDRCDDSRIASPEEQESFYKSWLDSLKS
ncbi:hypothetical protein [Marinobacter sp. HN1S83]|uniref:hypothetical protein n=1 Tax=Marinobacter sp. HN1S83 TaxID=3382301 RepID=UPI00387AA8B1